MRPKLILLVALAAVVSIGVGTAFAAAPPLSGPGNTAQITLVSSSTVNGWKYDFYRNRAYTCSISGFQTFVIGTKVGSSPTATKPLWVFMHGGGVGYFDANGIPRPNSGQMTENNAATLQGHLTNAGLLAKVRADAAGFRTLAVSYCNRDLYSGANQVDPNNPNLTASGAPKKTNGLLATKAAIQFTRSKYPTAEMFLHGGSAGSAGAYYVSWALQQQGIAPAGVVGDASVVNAEQGSAAYEQGVCANQAFGPEATAIISQRLHPEIADINNEVDKLVRSRRLTVPLMHVWNHGDTNTCGSTPMICPFRNGTTGTMGATDCVHQPLKSSIASQGIAGKSKNLPLCVDADAVKDCSLHVVTTKAGLTNTDPASPADYLGAIMTWVHSRLADA